MPPKTNKKVNIIDQLIYCIRERYMICADKEKVSFAKELGLRTDNLTLLLRSLESRKKYYRHNLIAKLWKYFFNEDIFNDWEFMLDEHLLLVGVMKIASYADKLGRKYKLTKTQTRALSSVMTKRKLTPVGSRYTGIILHEIYINNPRYHEQFMYIK